MPPKLDRCVRHVMGQGQDQSGAWAICSAALEGKAKPSGLAIDDALWQKAVELARLDAGNALKAVDSTPDMLRVGNYLVLWGSPEQRDLEGLGSDRHNADGTRGDYFTPETQFTSDYTDTGTLYVDWEHGRDPDQIGSSPDTVLGTVDWKSARLDDAGLYVERVLNRRHRYMQWMEQLIEAGLLGNSSAAVNEAVKRADDGRILSWPLRRDTLTVTPMEPRALTENPVAAKALEELKAALMTEAQGQTGGLAAPSKKQAQAPGQPSAPGAQPKTTNDTGQQDQPDKTQEKGEAAPPEKAPQKPSLSGGNMNLIDKIKMLVPGLTDDQYNQIAAVIELALSDPNEVFGPGTPDDLAQETAGVDTGAELEGKTLKRMLVLTSRMPNFKGTPFQKMFAKMAPAATPARPPFAATPAQAEKSADAAQVVKTEGQASKTEPKKESDMFKAVYLARFGEESAAQKAVMTDLVGHDYRQRISDQNAAFVRYLRHGDRGLDSDSVKALKMQIFPMELIMDYVRDGASVEEIKATMIEAQGSLGGYAVPPNVQQEIIKRLPGLVAVRGAGAIAINLINSNSIEIPVYAGGDKRYVGALRGEWAGETATPNAKTALLGMETVTANVYTYKVPMSQSLVEDAANLVQLVQNDIATTLAIDEDDAFLVGDGVGKPLGFLPGGSNTLGLKEVASGNASAETAAGIKNLKRGVPTQYRKNAAWVGASDTWSAVEVLTVATASATYAFPDLSEEEKLLNRQVYESEAMPAVGAGNYPILFGDFSAYRIVQGPGLTIARFQDSNTGLNKVEFHVRRRIGGRPAETWKMAVQKVAASL